LHAVTTRDEDVARSVKSTQKIAASVKRLIRIFVPLTLQAPPTYEVAVVLAVCT
jgi:hypothetical protein